MKLDIIGVPTYLGYGSPGVDLGPKAIRYAGLDKEIISLGHEYKDLGDIKIPKIADYLDSANITEYINIINAMIYKKVKQSIQKKHLPLLLGGDHSIAIGSAIATQSIYENIGVLWIDAHTDYNTAETSFSGNIHGMPLAAITGAGVDHILPFKPIDTDYIDPKKCVVIANRSVDESETYLIREKGLNVFSMADIDMLGAKGVMDKAIKIVTEGTNGYHLSFDMDAITPEVAPGVSTPVRGGLTFREAHLIAEMISETPGLRSLEFVEINPLFDNANTTGELAVSLIAAILGRRFTVPKSKYKKIIDI